MGIKKITPYNSLKSTHPKLAEQWSDRNPFGPELVLPYSRKKAWWKCQNGHEWYAETRSRTYQRTGCPFCYGLLATPQNNLSLYPKLVEEIHPTKNGIIDATKFCPHSNKKLWWICKNGHEWYAKISDRNHKTKGTNCPCCIKRYSNLEIRVLSELCYFFSNVNWHDTSYGVEIDIYLPEHKIAIEVDGNYWHKNRTDNDKKKNKTLSNLGIRTIRVREQPLKFISSLDVFSRTTEEHLPIMKRLINKLNYLTKIDALKNYFDIKNETLYNELCSKHKPNNSIATLREDLVKEWHPTKNGVLKPDNFSLGSHKKIWWICTKGHEYEMIIKNKQREGNGCPFCSGHRTCQDNCLATTNPELSLSWDYTKNTKSPKDYTTNSGAKVWWICKEGHSWKSTIDSRTRGKGCPFCANKKVYHKNCLATIFPKIASQWHPTLNGTLKPTDVMSKSSKRIWWLCNLKHKWETSIKNRTILGTNCPYCYKTKHQSHEHLSDQ